MSFCSLTQQNQEPITSDELLTYVINVLVLGTDVLHIAI